ncbi:hypothetical protein Q0601_00815 [Paracoccus onubensis]|uniref:hypothetical protein n=1 Tax=Paracoccus onubensis TaxID=1675788 RepID=UPI0027303245|nr:hypothetical protein [Paracoccus onubensis]MDP0925703.1 hypothetical protein [Paracoccus onubensis]
MKAKYDKYGAFIGYEKTGKILATIKGDEDSICAMRERLAGAFAQPTEDQVEEWVAELSLIAPKRFDGDGNEMLRLRAYVSRLREYPADVVREALLSRVWRFFPSWAELSDACDELVAHRRAVRVELDRAEEKIRDRELRARALPTEKTVTLTPEESEKRRKATMAHVNGIISSMREKLSAQQVAEQEREDALLAKMKRPPEVK